MSRILILSDGRAGHESQSVALAKHLGIPYDVVKVSPRGKWGKAAGYLLDRFGLYTAAPFRVDTLPHDDYTLVVGAGSSTYYPLRVLAGRFGARSVAMMLPKGFRYGGFDRIYAPWHDAPPRRPNIVPIPANFAYAEPRGLYRATRPAVGIVIGGDSRHHRLDAERLRAQLDRIAQRYGEYEIAVTTSPRTSGEIEALVSSYGFDYEVIHSRDRINPIPDMLEQCERVFVTADSTSMISEAVSHGRCHVVVLPTGAAGENKLARMTESLRREGYLTLFGEEASGVPRKIDFALYARKVQA